MSNSKDTKMSHITVTQTGSGCLNSNVDSITYIYAVSDESMKRILEI
jgi:hypothetical protein